MKGLLILFMLLPLTCFTQSNFHAKVNSEVYHQFSKAYLDSDAELFRSLHSMELIRVSSGSKTVRTYDQYLGDLENRWAERDGVVIEFRIKERIHSDTVISDRGVYKITYELDTGQRLSYGSFHVLIKLEQGSWRFVLDYDQPASGGDFEAAHPLDHHEKYVKTKEQ